MKRNKFTVALSVATFLLAPAFLMASDTPHESSYAEVTRTVEVGDFDAMAVLVLTRQQTLYVTLWVLMEVM